MAVMRIAAVAVLVGGPALAEAQSLGTFRWQLLPYCNVVTVAVTQNGGIYRLEGTDDQCGGGRDLAAVQGLAFPNPDGTIGFGMTIVTAPGGAPVHVDAEIAIATASGTWRDSTGTTGTFAFTPGDATGGSRRPPAPPAIPPAFQLAPTGNLLAAGTVGVGTAPASGPGTRLMWYPGKQAFRAGVAGSTEWDDANVGQSSTAMGTSTLASGRFSVAMGYATKATGNLSVALGGETTASNNYSIATGLATTASGLASTAMGARSVASGESSVAMGSLTTASGRASTAIGEGTISSGTSSLAGGHKSQAAGVDSVALGDAATATGSASIALGDHAVANGDSSVALGRAFTTAAAVGSFVFGDTSNTSQQVAFAPHSFVVRAAGGARFFSHATSNIGPVLVAGGTDWLAASDVALKHRFRDLDGEDVLGRIARMPVTEWGYKAQDPAIRHIGPTAQDFYAAFGLGQDPLRISPLDSGGVALASVKALEARTRDLIRANRDLARENADLKGRLARLEAAVKR